MTAVNDAPVAVDDAYTTAEDTALTVDAPGVLLNDTDVEGDAVSAIVVTGPTHGSLTLNADGSFIYAPDANFNGADTLHLHGDGRRRGVERRDGHDHGHAGQRRAGRGQRRGDDAEDAASAANVLANDTDVDGGRADGDARRRAPATARVTLNADGTFTYTPAANFNGTDSFTYTASDGTAARRRDGDDHGHGGQRRPGRGRRRGDDGRGHRGQRNGSWPTTPTSTATTLTADWSRPGRTARWC